jgi:hypothetical protein
MNAYLFSGGVTNSQGHVAQRGSMFGASFSGSDTDSESRPVSGKAGKSPVTFRTWDSCVSQIVAGNDPAEAQSRFEAWLVANPTVQVEIKKVVATQFVGQLLAEAGAAEIDWPRVCQDANAILEGTPVDDFEQGYWVDPNEILGPGQTSSDINALQRGLPDDIRDSLNWAPEKTFLFVVSVLSPPVPPPDPVEEFEDETPTATEGNTGNTDDEKVPLDPSVAELPDLLDKEAAALVKARNSVVAAWLWRKFAAGTPLAANRIHISPWCGAIGFEPLPAA